MPDTSRSVVELVAILAGWSVFAGGILRYFMLEWVKRREAFEVTITSELKAVNVRIDESSKAHIAAVEFVRSESSGARDNLRKEGEAAHRTLREHVDHEDRILRERTHALDTLTQVLVNNITAMRRDMDGVMTGQKDLVDALGEVNITLATLKKE